MEERTGTVCEVIFRSEENGYTVAVMETDDEYITVVGNLPNCAKGSRFTLRGTVKEHPLYGEQFAFTEFMEIMPENAEAIFDFLRSGVIKGVGPVTAAALVAKFGDDTLKIIEEEPEKLTEVSGIGEKTADKIVESFRAHREFADVSIALQEYGLSIAQAMRLYAAYGTDAVDIVQSDPYRLIDEVPGFGFRKADVIAAKMGVSGDDPVRLASGIKFALWQFAAEGNAFVPRDELAELVGGLLDQPIELIDDRLVELAFSGEIRIDLVDGVEACYLFPYFVAERAVAYKLFDLKEAELRPIEADIDKMIAAAESASGIELSPRQKRAVTAALTGGVSLITGGPGTGKTTIINTIIRILEGSGLKTAVCAPTGRAAKRVTETTGHYASTIHRLLEYYYSEDTDEMRFGKTQEDQLEYDAVIVDEASMIDILLMKGLTDALKPGTRLILIGDCDQLPPVGAGNVLRDIMESDTVDTIRLTEIFRQAGESMIIVNAHRINSGEYPFLNEKDKDFYFMERRDEESCLALLVELAGKRLPAYIGSSDPLSDIQVLTPTRKGPLGTVALNEVLQKALNPPAADKNEKSIGGRIFREGDKVMQIRNNYQIGWKRRRDLAEGQGIFNGDVGLIRRIDSEYGRVTVVFDDERFVEYEFAQMDELEHAYAVTVHKSQGSEFPVVVMPVMNVPPALATRNLLYTAVTRGKELVVLLGRRDRLFSMVDNNSIRLRYSGLGARLRALAETGI
ncbi:MAG: ATP-dependent RecD-like DNA helicase [Clostridia bacterium]|nr:ATP-dependent RecD-like DNA helicase [Clostridia bacterium]